MKTARVDKAIFISMVTVIAMFIVAKSFSILAMTPDALAGSNSVIGRVAQIASWLFIDLVAGACGGLGLGMALHGLTRRHPTRRTIVLWVHGVLLSVFLALSIEVIRLFGVQPQIILLAALSKPGDAGDSLASLLSLRFVVHFFILSTVAIVLPRLLLTRRIRRPRFAIGILVAITILLIVVGRIAPKQNLELDRNPLASTIFSLWGQDEIAVAQGVGDFQSVFESVTDKTDPNVDLSTYSALQAWAKDSKPNVVLVIWESTSPSHMEAFGGPVANTPTMTEMVNHGISWPNHYAHTPTSMFAIYSIVASNFTTPFGGNISNTRPRIAADSLSEVFDEHGYTAGLFHSGHFSFFEKDLFFAGRGYDLMVDALTMPNRQKYKDGSWGIEEQAAVDAMIDWSSKQRDPFFITYIPFSPHHPYDVPRQEYRRTFDGDGQVAKYRNAIFYMDAMLGQLMQRIEEIGNNRPTLYVVVGDHGEGFGEHPGSYMHGLTLYQEGVQSFVTFYSPQFKKAYADPRTFGHIDLAPTLLDIMGLPLSPVHMGKSALSRDERPIVALYSGKTARKNMGFIDGPWKYMTNLQSGTQELYHLVNDPAEKNNVAKEHSEWMAQFNSRSHQFLSERKYWESHIPDLEDPLSNVDKSKLSYLELSVASCPLDSTFFKATEGGDVVMTRAGTQHINCSLNVEESGLVLSFEVEGNEAINGALIAITLVKKGTSKSAMFAHCILNGNNKKTATRCDAQMTAEKKEIRAGDTLNVELRYTSPAAGFSAEDFSAKRVRVGYLPAEH